MKKKTFSLTREYKHHHISYKKAFSANSKSVRRKRCRDGPLTRRLFATECRNCRNRTTLSLTYKAFSFSLFLLSKWSTRWLTTVITATLCLQIFRQRGSSTSASSHLRLYLRVINYFTGFFFSRELLKELFCAMLQATCVQFYFYT